MSSDSALAEKVLPLEEAIDRTEREIESVCFRLLLQQQPVAHDLRQISAALKMITDYERIGDQAADIAEIIISSGLTGTQNCEYIGDMAKAVIKMVNESAEAYVKRDIGLAKAVIAYDDVADGYFDKIRNNLKKMIYERPDEGEFEIDILMIAKYFERIGDHATNIAEWVVYSVTGKHGIEN